MGVKVRIDGVMVLTGLVVAAGSYAYVQRDKIKKVFTEDLNPASNKNIIYDSLGGNDPDSALTSGADFIFGTFDSVFGIQR